VDTFSALIPVLVTGIQQRRVGGAENSFHAKDFAWLDSCDKHRNEGKMSLDC
jgi:ribose transport system ATP-binding protein